jgi:acyl carrier protein
MREKILKVVFLSIENFNSESELQIDITEGEKTRLFGGSGILDSLGLVTLIVDLEENIEDEFDVTLSLANEKAMSRRVSPFSSIKLIVDYILDLIREEENA